MEQDMARKAEHPESELFDHLSGRLDTAPAREIEAHLEECPECASVAGMVEALRLEAKRLDRGHDLPRDIRVDAQRPGSEAGSLTRSAPAETPAESDTCGDRSGLPGAKASDPAPPTGDRRAPAYGSAYVLNFEENASSHPDTGELASFFYGTASEENRLNTGAHVALCRVCSESIAEYGRADRAAAEYDPARAGQLQVPAASWQMIRDWEESGLARPMEASEALGPEMLARLAALFKERKQEIRKVSLEAAGRASQLDKESELVPVILVDRQGEYRGVEMFEKAGREPGAEILRHPDETRFENKPLHAMLDYGGGQRILVSNVIKRGVSQIEYGGQAKAERSGAKYFIVED